MTKKIAASTLLSGISKVISLISTEFTRGRFYNYTHMYAWYIHMYIHTLYIKHLYVKLNGCPSFCLSAVLVIG